MGVDAQQWVGRSLMAVLRLRVSASGTDSDHGALELLWDDRSVLRIDADGGRIRVTDRLRSDSLAQPDLPVPTQQVEEVGRWQRVDLSRETPYARLIGAELRSVDVTASQVSLVLDGSHVSVDLRVGELVATVENPSDTRVHWRVEWRHDSAEDPVVHLEELVGSEERRKVEVWRDGRRGFASARVEHGGSFRSEGPLPDLVHINADPVFNGEVIDADDFEREWQAAIQEVPTTTLWRPTGRHELELVRASGMRRWPARLPDQPIFYPVTTREYAERIAREWNVPARGVGFVTRFEVVAAFMEGYPVHEAGGVACREWWVPASELPDLNDHIVGLIEVVEEVKG